MNDKRYVHELQALLSRRAALNRPPAALATWRWRADAALAAAAAVPRAIRWRRVARCLPARAKRVIFLFMQGGVSQVDSFDYKPQLTKHDGKPIDFDDDRLLANTGKAAPRSAS